MNAIAQLRSRIDRTSLFSMVVSVALFMELIDASITYTAIPKMAAYFAVPPVSLRIIVTSYLLSLAVFVPISGWISDRFGAKRVFVTAIAVFVLASVFCGFSRTPMELALWRFVQGAGGALMSPVGRLLLLRTFGQKELVRITAITTLPALVGPAIGPVLGGLIVQKLNWYWVFFVNVIPGALCLYLATTLLEDNFKTEATPFDFSGFFQVSVGLIAIQLLLDFYDTPALSRWGCLALALIPLACGIVYAFHYRAKRGTSVMDLSIFRIQPVRVGLTLGLVMRLCIGGIVFLLTLLYQGVLGMSPLASGCMLLPVGLGALMVRPFYQMLLDRFDHRGIHGLSMALTVGSLFAMATISGHPGALGLSLRALVFGFGYSLNLMNSNVFYYYGVPEALMGQATSIQMTFRQFFLGLGVVASVFSLHGARQLLGSRAHATTTGFQLAFLVLAVFSLVYGLASLLLWQRIPSKALIQDMGLD